MVTAIELAHKVRLGDINAAKDQMEILCESSPHIPLVDTPEFVFALRTAIGRNDAAMCRTLTMYLDDTDVVDHNTVLAAALKDHDVFMSVVGVGGHCLENPKLLPVHPLVVAASAGNFNVAKFIVDWIRAGGKNFLSQEGPRIKKEAVMAAATAGSVSIIQLLASDGKLLTDAFKVMVSSGKIDDAKRLATDERVDFVGNKFELLKLCAPYPELLYVVMKHPTLKPHAANMPTPYSQLAMDAAMDIHAEQSDMISHSFKHKLMLQATNKIMKSGCSTRAAVTAAHSELIGTCHDNVINKSFFS